MESINTLVEFKVRELIEMKEEIQEEMYTCENMIKFYQEKIKNYQEEIEKAENQVKSEIMAMVPEKDYKKAKTQVSYKFPSGQLIRKKKTEKIILNKEFDETEIPPNFIKTKITKAVDWINFKKKLVISNEKIVNVETGEIITKSCDIEKMSEEIKLKIT